MAASTMRAAQELRVKESDRIAAVVEGLRGFGAAIEATGDGFVVTGTAYCAAARSTPAAITASRCSARSRGRRRAGVAVVGMEAAAVSCPAFMGDLATLS